MGFTTGVYYLANGPQFEELTDGKPIVGFFLCLFVGNRANLVEVSIMEEVLGGLWKIICQLFDKGTLIFDEKAIVLGNLSSKSAEVSSSNRFPTS